MNYLILKIYYKKKKTIQLNKTKIYHKEEK